MEKSYRKEIIYSLCIEDVQTVAEQEIERELTIKEIHQIKDAITVKINWYDAIADAIHQNFKAEELH
ncbi:MAG: hypothetical protein IIB05_04630 [Bacteroidetes bacterium]|nr:hypothetical protein [Bacteroidota bacterium]